MKLLYYSSQPSQQISPTLFQSKLKRWFSQFGRGDLPWQMEPTPYRVWISEIMLQQTQVKTVIPFYQKFMQRYPTLETLAHSSIDELITYWAGLGYYARARNLHKAAQVILNEFNGKFPQEVKVLETLPGIGRSTAGAILSLSDTGAAPILDGNVKRVLCRLFGVTELPNSTSGQKKLWEISSYLTPKKAAKAYNQAMMDLGATLCTPTRPACDRCPFQELCYAFQYQQQQQLPTKKQKSTPKPTHQKWYLVLSHRQKLLLKQRPAQGIWSHLWIFPEFDSLELLDNFLHSCGTNAHAPEQKSPSTLKHSFTHFDLQMHFVYVEWGNAPKKPLFNKTHLKTAPFAWWDMHAEIFHSIGCPAPIRKVIEQLYTKAVDLKHERCIRN